VVFQKIAQSFPGKTTTNRNEQGGVSPIEKKQMRNEYSSILYGLIGK